MVIRDKAYYESFNRRMKYLHEMVDYHVEQANSWKAIYRITKNKRGYGWLNKFAKYMNGRHVKKGIKIANKCSDECFAEMTYLTNYLAKD